MYTQQHKHTKRLIVGLYSEQKTQDIEMQLDNDGLMLLVSLTQSAGLTLL